MILIPAIDLVNGQCVRLKRGNFEEKTIYNHDPVAVAQHFESTGFTHLHLVDLDGARQQNPVHFDILKKISLATRLQVDFSGGIRNMDQASEAFKNGASLITLGSMAVDDPETTHDILQAFGPEKLILGGDVKAGQLATHGWQRQSGMDLFSFLEYWLKKGFRKVMITDVARDGMLQGPCLELYRRVLEAFPGILLIASGGVASAADIGLLRQQGCYGAIIGKALYENIIDPKSPELNL